MPAVAAAGTAGAASGAVLAVNGLPQAGHFTVRPRAEAGALRCLEQFGQASATGFIDSTPCSSSA